jgi:hypothetical protein
MTRAIAVVLMLEVGGLIVTDNAACEAAPPIGIMSWTLQPLTDRRAEAKRLVEEARKELERIEWRQFYEDYWDAAWADHGRPELWFRKPPLPEPKTPKKPVFQRLKGFFGFPTISGVP